MKLPARIVMCLLPFFLTACFHRTARQQVQPIAPPIEDSSTPRPAPTSAELPASVLTIPSQPTVPEVKTQPQTPPKPPAKHRKQVNRPTQQASNGSPGVSAIGQLSSGSPFDLYRQTQESIASTERGLNSVGRSLNGQEQKIAAQIREFLKQAHKALASGDADGAHTLAAKAKVLLGELSR